MTDEETQAYQLALLWTQKASEYFPNVRIEGNNRLRATGDPRKSALFKHLIRMIRRTRGLVKPEDIKHYMVAQLWVCKHNNEEGQCHLGPEMLSGPAAWKRWKVYEKLLTQARERRAGNAAPAEEKISMENVRSDLQTSLTFLQKYDKRITPAFLRQRYAKGEIQKWLKFGFIRPYFVALSPTLQSLGATVTGELSGIKNAEVIAEFQKTFPEDI